MVRNAPASRARPAPWIRGAALSGAALSVALAAAALAAAATVRSAPYAQAGGDAPAEDPYERILETHRRKLRTSDPDAAVAAVKLLDPANPRSMPEFLGILPKFHWRVRGAVIEAMASIPAGPLRAEMRLHLVTHEDAWVREGMAYAMTLGPVAGDAEALVGALDDPEWRVRRTAARGLGEIVSRAGVERLVRCVREEKDLRVLIWARASLRGIAREDFGRDGALWQAWWDVHKDRPEWKKQGDEVLRADFAGIPLERITVERTAASEEDRKLRESRPELVVLAPFGWTHGWFRPYLDEASEFVKVVYVTLPTVQEVTGASGYGQNIPEYPVDRLAKALEDMRKRDGREKLLILAAGPVTWIAERYAVLHPDRVAGLVLVDGWLDSQAYVEALTRLARDGTPGEKRAAATLMGPGARDREEEHDLRSAFLTGSLTDIRDSEAFRIWRDCRRAQGFATVPSMQFNRHVRIETPTLFMFPDPEVQPFSGGTAADFRRIRDSFKEPPPVTAVLRDTRGLAHAEDPVEFLRIVGGFLDYAGVKKDPPSSKRK